MNNTHRENGTTAGPLIFTVPAYGFVMALYLDCMGRTPTRERLPLTCVERTRNADQVSSGLLSSSYNGFNEVTKSVFKGSEIRQ